MITVDVTVHGDTLDIEEREELIEVFTDLDHQLAAAKWNLAKLWLYGSIGELTAEQQLEVAGLV
jgi:hypothetical protein